MFLELLTRRRRSLDSHTHTIGQDAAVAAAAVTHRHDGASLTQYFERRSFIVGYYFTTCSGGPTREDTTR